MCDFCSNENSSPITMIESKKISNSIWINYFCGNQKAEIDKNDIFEDDFSVVFEIRNGHGYIRLVDRDDMNCLDHGEYFEIQYCFMCGKKL